MATGDLSMEARKDGQRNSHLNRPWERGWARCRSKSGEDGGLWGPDRRACQQAPWDRTRWRRGAGFADIIDQNLSILSERLFTYSVLTLTCHPPYPLLTRIVPHFQVHNIHKAQISLLHPPNALHQFSKWLYVCYGQTACSIILAYYTNDIQ